MNLLRTLKKFGWLALLILAAPTAWGFSLLGPEAGAGAETWQSATIGYNFAYSIFLNGYPGGPVQLGDIGGPHNLGEGYRRNTPTMYYACDANFIGFFGVDGLNAVDQAFAIMNNAFTNENGVYLPNGVDSYSSGLTGFPLETVHINPTAQALYLTDLKSVTLHAIVEQMGLDQPERFTWTLADRAHVTGFPGCPLGMEYLVVQRNFDIINSPLNQVQYSPYVNGTLYSYEILEGCNGTPAAVTLPFSVDPYADTYTAVAADNFLGLNIGSFYTGLTRDDVAGLRYLMTTNVSGLQTENAAVNAFLEVTNLGPQQLLTTSNFNTLYLASLTNDPGLLPAMFPGLVVDTVNSSVTFTDVCTPNIISYLTNFIGSPVGSPPLLFVTTNGVNCVDQEVFQTVYANVITNGNVTNFPGIILPVSGVHMNYYPNTAANIQITELAAQVGAPYPPPIVTNTTTTPIVFSNQPSGEYFILPPGQCGWKILQVLSTNTPFNGHPELAQTNVIATATNANGFVDTESIVTYFTNHTFVVQPITCSNVVDVPRLRQGIEKIHFVRADFDSLIGQYWQPLTNEYTMNVLTNGKIQTLRYQRVLTVPDILLTAASDTLPTTIIRNITFDQTTIYPGEHGPGIISPEIAGTPPLPGTTISYNKIGDSFRNGTILTFTTNLFVSEFDQMPLVQWASFDASTNPPILYPNGTSIQNLTNLIYAQVSPAPPYLPAGNLHTAYSPVTFSLVSGPFVQPFTWSASTLPSGLTLTTNPDSTATLSGTPTQAGTYDFTLTLTDAASRSVPWNYTITINP
jgi:hypothetical protein